METLHIIQEMKVIPIVPENKLYIIVQYLVIFLCVTGAILSTIWIRRKYENSIYILIFFVYVPMLETYPTIYVWYDYNTNANLATDADSAVSEVILILGVTSIVIYFLQLVFICLRTKDIDSKEGFGEVPKFRLYSRGLSLRFFFRFVIKNIVTI